MSATEILAILGALVVRRLEALATTHPAANDSGGDELCRADAFRRARDRVCDTLRRLDAASVRQSPAGLPGRWPEPWDDSDDASARRPSAVANRIARGEGTPAQIRALAAGYRGWTERMSHLEWDYRRSIVDALMLKLAENARDVRARISRALMFLGEDACLALCAEVRDIEDAGGLSILATRQRRTRGGVWFALLKARYRWARFAMPHRPVQAEDGRARAANRDGPEASPQEPAARPPLMPEPASAALPAVRPVSSTSPEVIALRRRPGALLKDSSTEGAVDGRQRGDVGLSANTVARDAGDA